MKKVILIVAVLILSQGCSQKGQNMRLAGIDSSSTLATTAILDRVPDPAYEKTRETVVKISAELIAFIHTGNLYDLPLNVVKDKLTQFMITKGYQDYIYILDTAFSYISNQKVKIEDNQITQIILTSLESIHRSAKRSTLAGKN